MMLFKNALLVFTIFCSAALSQSVDELFSTALKSYQEGRFEDAKTGFEQALMQQPNNPSLLYNLGLAEYRLGHMGPAIALWRKALNIDNSLTDAETALQFALGKLEKKDLPRQMTFEEKFRTNIITAVSINQTLGLLALTMIIFGWVLFSYLGQRRLAQEAQEPPPPFKLKLLLVGVFFVASTLLVAAKTLDYFTPRGTVVEKSVAVRAGPDMTYTTLFEMSEGFEIIIEAVQSDWLKILYPGGRTGWVPKSSVLQTSGKGI